MTETRDVALPDTSELYYPDPALVEQSNVMAYARSKGFNSYDELYQWTISHDHGCTRNFHDQAAFLGDQRQVVDNPLCLLRQFYLFVIQGIFVVVGAGD